jgi:cytochrome d ubiquinol oxidase subunit II
VNLVDAVAALLWLVVTFYALTGGADFGGGTWDLLAGGTERGTRPRDLIDRSISTVWEANHVWLVIVLVVLWTAFPVAFAAIMSTLFVPLSLAAFGIILRGAGFALRGASEALSHRRLAGAVFALSSLVTPFFFGAAAGAIVTGQVPVHGGGDRIASWTSASALVLGGLAVASFAYLAAVYLTVEARQRDASLVAYFTRRAMVSGVLVGGLGAAALVELHGSAPRIVHRLLGGVGLPFLIVSAVFGSSVLILLALGHQRFIRVLAAGAFTALIWGWGVSQYPILLPPSLSLGAGAAPSASLVSELVVVGVIALLVLPSFALLYRLQQRGQLGGEGGG